jgi:hypothetical protein
MEKQIWTFETLVQANRATLEHVLLNSQAPDMGQLAGFGYDGYNHDWLGQLSARKFRKVFLTKNGQYYGLNQIVHQDGNDFTGQWRIQMENDRPVEMGFFRVIPASGSSTNRRVVPYSHLICFDYNIDMNPRGSVLMRAIRDYVGMPNAGDYELMLGKAYLRLTPFLHTFASYFVLGNRKPYEQS